MKWILTLLPLFWFYALSAQLDCKTITDKSGGSTITCFHENQSVSTLISWDKDYRFGNAKGFDSKGTLLFNVELRKIGGHASVQLKYYKNGQVSSMEYSDAPDGGIQFYESKTTYSELGERTSFHETKYPFELTTQPLKVERKDSIKITEPRTEKCATLVMNYFEIQNTTNAKLEVVATRNQTLNWSKKMIKMIVLPHEKLVFDSIPSAEKPINKAVYDLTFELKTKKRKNKLITLELLQPKSTQQTKRNTWVFLKN